jgi:hypothetical protein
VWHCVHLLGYAVGCSTSVTITLKPGNPPQVRASTNVGSSKISVADRVILYGEAVSTSPNPLQITWSVSGQPAAFSSALLGSVTSASSIVLRKGVMVPGATYVFRFTATDTDLASASAEVAITVNAPPTSGYIEPEPASGTELQTEFSFTAAQWVDDTDDLPLSYVFAYIVGNVTDIALVTEEAVRRDEVLCKCS